MQSSGGQGGQTVTTFEVSKVDGGETLTETTTTMSRETSGTLGTKETSGSLGREENGQPLALRSKVYC